jgi:hypothetical protein
MTAREQPKATGTYALFIITFVVAAGISTATPANAAERISEEAYDRCRSISDDRDRLHCFENLTIRPGDAGAAVSAPVAPQNQPDAPPGDPRSPSGPFSQSVAGKWRLVRTNNPAERRDVISIMATGELAESDIEFAGLNLRCATPDFEVLVFLISPLPPSARPIVSLDGAAFPATVLLPGTAMLLSQTATLLAKERWKSRAPVTIDIDNSGTKIHGVISLDGFDKALQTLSATCLSP